MKKFIVTVRCEHILQYLISADDEETARRLVEDGNVDDSELYSDNGDVWDVETIEKFEDDC
jgi:hypothetical protein